MAGAPGSWRAGAFHRDVSASRYADVRKVPHAFVRWLIVQGVPQADPVLNLPSYQRQTPRKRSRDRGVTVADLQDVLSAIDGWMGAKRPRPRPSSVYRDLVILIAATACRPGEEALAVRRDDVDLDYEIRLDGDGAAAPHVTVPHRLVLRGSGEVPVACAGAGAC